MQVQTAVSIVSATANPILRKTRSLKSYQFLMVYESSGGGNPTFEERLLNSNNIIPEYCDVNNNYLSVHHQ
jgi:hypothetical protein